MGKKTEKACKGIKNKCIKVNSLFQLFTKQQIFRLVQIESILMGECNTILSAYTLYRHLG